MANLENVMDFEVTIELDEKPNTVIVTVPVTDDEVDAMIDLYCEYSYLDLEDSDETQELYERIKDAALVEWSLEDSEDLEININMPYIANLAESSLEWENYSDYPFAMEVVNGQIISLTEEMGNAMLQRLLEKLNVTEEELAEYMLARYRDYNSDYDDWDNDVEDEEEQESIEDKIQDHVLDQLADRRFAMLSGYEYDALECLLSFCYEEPSVGAPYFGFLDCKYGFEAASLLADLGFDLGERIKHGAHGHDTTGVQFIRHIQ